MLKDRMVRIKLIKRYSEQRPFSYVGKVTGFSDTWIVMEAKGVMVSRHSPNGAQIDKTASPVVIPRDNIESIRVIPDNFNMENIRITTEGQQLVMYVDGVRDVYIGDMGEG